MLSKRTRAAALPLGLTVAIAVPQLIGSIPAVAGPNKDIGVDVTALNVNGR